MTVTFPVQKINRRKIRTELLGQGQRMSNWLYNIKQEKELPERYRREAEQLQKAWDEIKQRGLTPGRD